MFNIVGRRWAKVCSVYGQMGLEPGFPVETERKQHCPKSSLSCALFRQGVPYLRGRAFHIVDIFIILKIIFTTTLLSLNLNLCIYYSNFLAIKYPILTKPGYYDNFLRDVNEVS